MHAADVLFFRHPKLFLVLAALVAVASACQRPPEQSADGGDGATQFLSEDAGRGAGMQAAHKMAAEPMEMGIEMGMPVPGSQPPASPSQAGPRKVTRTAVLEIWVSDYGQVSGQVTSRVESAGGFISSVEVWDENGVRSAHLSLRVPADRLDEAMAHLRTLGRVRHESIGSEDISDIYYDTEARLRNLRTAEERIVELLRQTRGKLADILDAERELNRIRTDIESLTGQMERLNRQVALSTIELDLHEQAARQLPGPGDVWLPLRDLFGNFGVLLRESAGTVVRAVAGAIRLAILLLPWALGAGLLLSTLRMWRKRRQAKSQPG